eukprot:g20802.t1
MAPSMSTLAHDVNPIKGLPQARLRGTDITGGARRLAQWIADRAIEGAQKAESRAAGRPVAVGLNEDGETHSRLQQQLLGQSQEVI